MTALHPDADGSMWVGTASGMLHVASDGALLPLQANGRRGERVDQLFRDRQGVLWIATERGVFRLQDNQLQSFAPGSALAVNRVLSLYEDREGDLWLGTDSGGLHLLRDQKFTTYTTSDGLSGNLVRCVFRKRQGRAVDRHRRGGVEPPHQHAASPTSPPRTACPAMSSFRWPAAAGGDLWIGTPNGLNLLHHERTGLQSSDSLQPTACPTTSSAPSTPTATAACGSEPGTGWPTWRGASSPASPAWMAWAATSSAPSSGAQPGRLFGLGLRAA